MPFALITGAAKGIGKSIAKELAKRHYHLFLIDKDGVALDNTANEIESDFKNISVNLLKLDLAKPEAISNILKWTKDFHPQISILVNNAGFGLNGAFAELPLEDQLEIIDVNIKAQVMLTYHFIPILSRLSKAYILNVGSTTSYQPVPFMTLYAASKAFVLSFNRSLRHELKGSSISLTCLSPGATDTDFVKRANMQAHTLRLAERFNMHPDDVAKIAIEGLFKGKEVVIPGFSNKINAYLPRWVPTSWALTIATKIYKRKEETAVNLLPPAQAPTL